MILFDELAHKYTIWSDDGKTLITDKTTSATTFLKVVEPIYPREFWLSFKAIEAVIESRSLDDWHIIKGRLMRMKTADIEEAEQLANRIIDKSKYRSMMLIKRKEIDEKWIKKNLDSQIKGTKEHKKREDLLIYRNTSQHMIFEHPVINGLKASTPLKKLEFGYWYPEIMLNYKDLLGTCDEVKLEWINNRYVIHLNDWKTNIKIDFEGYYDHYAKKRNCLEEPVSHLEDCKFNRYRLQLSLYMFMIMQELGEENCIIGSCKITHIINERDIEYPFNPLIKEIKAILKLTGRLN